ncbi:MAG: DNA-processing protein DprA [Ruminococcus sp.]|nr:DNA-processing protein DprA [Ruminococcus sp.]
MNDKKYWLWLTMVFGIGSRRIWELMSLFETPDEAYHELRSGSSAVRLYGREKDAVNATSVEAAERVLAECDKKGVRTVAYSSADYPPQLRHIMNPPAILYYVGDICCLTGTRTVTAVGARKATEYSLSVTERICGELAARGMVIVSGFAVGVDITAHMAAASQGRPTAAVMGCGVDVDYPRENFRFRDVIIEAGGVLISEYPVGTPPHAGNFPKRNRILSALGRATVVFEASVKSGSLITASLAAEQGRDVFCMPPADIFSGAYSGNAALLREGAVPFFGVSDIASVFGYGTVAYEEVRAEALGILAEEERPLRVHDHRMKPVSALETYIAENGTNAEGVPEVKRDEPKLEGVQKAIADALAEGALHADVLAQRLGMDSSELMTELTEMELLGAVRALPGKIYEKC